MKRKPPPTAAEHVLDMTTLAGITLKAENGRLELEASRPIPERLRALIERHEAALVALLAGRR